MSEPHPDNVVRPCECHGMQIGNTVCGICNGAGYVRIAGKRTGKHEEHGTYLVLDLSPPLP